ncbi:hypothetical protein P4267_28620, partial [Bacillus thuringiensis]|nr:hypothetical protein [Bacillus thuringiensis]
LTNLRDYYPRSKSYRLRIVNLSVFSSLLIALLRPLSSLRAKKNRETRQGFPYLRYYLFFFSSQSL